MTRKQHRRNGRNEQESSPANDSGRSPQEVMEVGQQAAQLLNYPVYNLAHQMCMEETIGLWAQTKPEEVKKREALWQELQALGRVPLALKGLVARAEELLSKQQQHEQKREEEYLDQQGFGDAWPGDGPANFQ